MNALLVIHGARFQTVPDESLLGVEPANDQFHGCLHLKQSVFVIDGQKDAFWAFVKLEEHRTYASQKRGP